MPPPYDIPIPHEGEPNEFFRGCGKHLVQVVLVIDGGGQGYTWTSQGYVPSLNRYEGPRDGAYIEKVYCLECNRDLIRADLVWVLEHMQGGGFEFRPPASAIYHRPVPVRIEAAGTGLKNQHSLPPLVAAAIDAVIQYNWNDELEDFEANFGEVDADAGTWKGPEDDEPTPIAQLGEKGEGQLFETLFRLQEWLEAPLDLMSSQSWLHRIHRAMDGQEWSPDTLEEIALALKEAGFTIRDPNDMPEEEEDAAASP